MRAHEFETSESQHSKPLTLIALSRRCAAVFLGVYCLRVRGLAFQGPQPWGTWGLRIFALGPGV